MKKEYQVMVMSFDGDVKIERPVFTSIEAAWDYSNDLGSKWIFYPYHFVISGRTIKDTFDLGEEFRRKRISTVQRKFSYYFNKAEKAQLELNAEEFLFYMMGGGTPRGN